MRHITAVFVSKWRGKLPKKHEKCRIDAVYETFLTNIDFSGFSHIFIDFFPLHGTNVTNI